MVESRGCLDLNKRKELEMLQFWMAIFFLGLIGALSDVIVNQWSKSFSLCWYFMSTMLFIVFMTGLGLSIRIGQDRGYSLTAVVLVVLLVNIAGVALWDLVVVGSRFTSLQWLGVSLAIVAMVCFELGKG